MFASKIQTPGFSESFFIFKDFAGFERFSASLKRRTFTLFASGAQHLKTAAESVSESPKSPEP